MVPDGNLKLMLETRLLKRCLPITDWHRKYPGTNANSAFSRSKPSNRLVGAAAYWLGRAMHRKHPWRVLTTLRFLLTELRR